MSATDMCSTLFTSRCGLCGFDVCTSGQELPAMIWAVIAGGVHVVTKVLLEQEVSQEEPTILNARRTALNRVAPLF